MKILVGKFEEVNDEYLQCTMMGALLSGLYILTLRLYANRGVGYVRAPWSDQLVKWNCFTIRLEPL